MSQELQKMIDMVGLMGIVLTFLTLFYLTVNSKFWFNPPQLKKSQHRTNSNAN